MKDHKFRRGNANDKINADAKALHAVNQVLQALGIIRENVDMISIAHKMYATAAPQQHTRLRCHRAHELNLNIKKDAKQDGAERTNLPDAHTLHPGITTTAFHGERLRCTEGLMAVNNRPSTAILAGLPHKSSD